MRIIEAVVATTIYYGSHEDVGIALVKVLVAVLRKDAASGSEEGESARGVIIQKLAQDVGWVEDSWSSDSRNDGDEDVIAEIVGEVLLKTFPSVVVNRLEWSYTGHAYCVAFP